MNNLSIKQQDIFNKFIQKENIFITGAGGTGKTFLIKNMVDYAKINNISYEVCALTGCAAILLNCRATTLHAFSGIGLANGTINDIVDKVVKNKYKKSKWKTTELLIVDEVSMLSLKIFIIMDLIAKRVKQKRNIPFGGMQIIFAGDFYQLPPVGDESDPDTLKFCFESELWNQVFAKQNQIILDQIYRQKDNEYIKILNQLRVGKITRNTIYKLENCLNKSINENNPTILLPKRKDADNLNKIKLNILDKDTEQIFKMQNVNKSELILSKEQINNINIFTDVELEEEREHLSNNIMAEKLIKLRIGTNVMCIANLNMDTDLPIVNGSQGTVIKFVDGFPLVKFNNRTVSQLITNHIWQSDKIPGIAVKQIPLIYGWAITIHKAQGLTLDKALVDIGEEVFECGQTYVALSRIKSLEGLYLKKFDFTKIKVNKKVQKFYELLELFNKV